MQFNIQTIQGDKVTFVANKIFHTSMSIRDSLFSSDPDIQEVVISNPARSYILLDEPRLLEDAGLIPGRVIPHTLKIIVMSSLLDYNG